MGLTFSWPAGRLEEVLAEMGPVPSSPQPCSKQSIVLISGLINEHNLPEAKVGLASGVCAFLFLYISIRGFGPARVVISSDLPLGSALGSSASFCVSLSGALIALSGCVGLHGKRNNWFRFREDELELVNKRAFEGEKIIHGKPSGVDNTVSTFGNMIMLESGNLTPIKFTVPIKMLITNTKVPRNTRSLVAGVSERANQHHKFN